MDMKKISILDTSYFIKLKPLEQDTIHLTTEFIITELKDEKVNKIGKIGKELLQIKPRFYIRSKPIQRNNAHK